jgi:nucleotide-binding universal stress UspA family protein
MYEVILVPVDGSPRAETILPYVEGMASGRNSKVVFLQVIEPSTLIITPTDMVPYYDTELAERILKEAKAYVATCQRNFQAKGIEAEALVVQGPIVRTILDIAEEKNVGLIAMASHWRTGVTRVFYGSVAAGVLHGANRPLLLVRSQETS